MIPLVHLERVCRQKFTHIDLAAVDGVSGYPAVMAGQHGSLNC